MSHTTTVIYITFAAEITAPGNAKLSYSNTLASGVDPPVGGIENRKHRTPLRALTDLGSTGEQHRLTPTEAVYGHQDEATLERVDQRRPLEGDRIIRQEVVETCSRSTGRRLTRLR